MQNSFLKHLFYDFWALVALVVVVFSLGDAFGISTPPYVVLLFAWGLCFGEYWLFEKASQKFQNRFLNFLILLFVVGFFGACSLFSGSISGNLSSAGMRFDVLGYSCSWTFFCALYIFLITTLKVQNAKKSEKTVLPAKKGRGTLSHKAPPELEIDITPATAWKIIAFIFICIPYCILYVLQGFMSHAPQLWPLPIVLILSGCVFFMSGKRKYVSFLALCLFSIAVDLSGLKGAQGYGRTLVVSPLLIIFWGLYLAPGTFRSIVDILKSKKKVIKKGH